MNHDRTFCASRCANFDCDRHESNVEVDFDVSWSYFHPSCPDYIPDENPHDDTL